MRKLLFFTYDFPYPTTSGGKSRAYNLLKFGGSGLDITLFSFVRPNFQDEHRDELKKIGILDIHVFRRKSLKNLANLKSIVHPKDSIFKYLYYDPEIEKKMIQVITENNIEVVHFESLYTAYYIGENVKRTGARQIFGSENIEYKLYEEYVKKIPRILHIPFSLQVKKIQDEEEKFAKTADVTLAVTSDEAEFFKNVGAARVVVIPNGVDTREFQFKPSKRREGRTILFVGNFSYFPNRDAIDFFYNRVFKRLPRQYQFKIIGRDARKLNIQDELVETVEFVDDIKKEYYDADVFVSPIRMGGGTNFKVIEAMACGLPVIMHSSRVQSLDLTDKENVLAADSPEEFAQKLETLLSNDALQGKLAKAAREHIEKNYSWHEIGKKINKVWKES